MENVYSQQDFQHRNRSLKKSFLLLYRDGGDLSRCAVENLQTVHIKPNISFNIFGADTTTVKDIHLQYRIDTVPALLIFSGGELINVIKGCQNKAFYQGLADNALCQADAPADQPSKRITVYSTPTCPWCNTLKSYLRKNGVSFRDIDVSKDHQAAQELVRRSGQQGVPQTDINGQIVVGFDQAKLKTALNLQ